MKSALPVVLDADVDDGIVTTDEELEGFNIVLAIAVSEVAPDGSHIVTRRHTWRSCWTTTTGSRSSACT